MSRPFLFRAGLEGMAPEDSLHVLLPPEWARGSALVFLDRAFPEDEEGREKVRSLFDIEDNPDLPEIYGVFLAVTEEWRDGRCLLHLYAGDGEEVDINSPVSALIRPDADADAAAPPVLQLRLQQRYRAVEYAARSRFWPGKDGLLDWLRTTTLLYFLDKHEAILPASPESDEDLALAPVTARLQEQGLVGESADGATIAITEEGRDAIGALLSETESRIDQYDHFKDAALDPDLDIVEFGSGRGIDLRVQAFLAQGLDPARTVFLLRLYDGSLDEFPPPLEKRHPQRRLLRPHPGAGGQPPPHRRRIDGVGHRPRPSLAGRTRGSGAGSGSNAGAQAPAAPVALTPLRRSRVGGNLCVFATGCVPSIYAHRFPPTRERRQPGPALT